MLKGVAWTGGVALDDARIYLPKRSAESAISSVVTWRAIDEATCTLSRDPDGLRLFWRARPP